MVAEVVKGLYPKIGQSWRISENKMAEVLLADKSLEMPLGLSCFQSNSTRDELGQSEFKFNVFYFRDDISEQMFY